MSGSGNDFKTFLDVYPFKICTLSYDTLRTLLCKIYVADYILTLIDQISYTANELIIIANGGVLNNSFYRDSLEDAISFDFNNLKWLFPTISTAYYPGLLSCKIIGIDIKVEDILKENPIL